MKLENADSVMLSALFRFEWYRIERNERKARDVQCAL